MKNLLVLFLSFNMYLQAIYVKDENDNTVEVVSQEKFNQFKEEMTQLKGALALYIQANKYTDDELAALVERVGKLEEQLGDFIKKIKELQKLLDEESLP